MAVIFASFPPIVADPVIYQVRYIDHGYLVVASWPVTQRCPLRPRHARAAALWAQPLVAHCRIAMVPMTP